MRDWPTMKFNMCVLITLTIFLMSPILTDTIPDETTVSSELCLSHKLVNIDYLGIGYDIFLGNPRNNLYDPGFRQPVLKLGYEDKLVSSDGRWTIPDRVQVLQTQSCSYETETTALKDMQSYQKILSGEAKIDASGFGARFSASKGFKDLEEGMQKRKLIYLESVGICIHYKAKITDGAKIAENFRLDAESLPIDILNLEAYDSLFIKYGTHFVDDIVMGAKSIVRHAFQASALKSLKEKGVHVESSATASFLSITSGGSNKEDTQTKDLKEFESQRESYAALFLGSKPSVDGDWKTWAQTTYMQPFPVRYELKELSTLLVPTFFPNLNATELAYKRILASMALSKYCEKIEGCGEPKLPEEKPEPEIIVGVICEDRVGNLTCSTGVIRILLAFYGRLNRVTCPSDDMGHTSCFSDRVTYLKTLCEDKTSCEVGAHNGLGDPCSGTDKYIEVKYQCV